jgi:hypothetical protein
MLIFEFLAMSPWILKLVFSAIGSERAKGSILDVVFEAIDVREWITFNARQR